MTNLLHAAITDKAWRAYYNVYNAHGHDYPEAFYEEMMRLEFIALNVPHRTQVPYEIFYKGIKVSEHITDTELAEVVILEYKVIPTLLPAHHAKLVSYLNVSGKQVGLLFNFGSPRPHGVRRVLTALGQANLPPWHPGDPDPNLLYPDLTTKLRSVVWEVFHTLGCGFIFRIYANATYIELQKRGIDCEPVRKLQVLHRGQPIGDVPFRYLIVAKRVILLPIAESTITDSYQKKARIILKQHSLQLAMIVNFGNEKLEVNYIRAA